MKIPLTAALVLGFWVVLYSCRLSFAEPLSPGAALLGTACFLSFACFIVTSLGCQFHLDRRKVAEAKHWLPLGYMYPPKKYLRSDGRFLADIRYYSGILSFVLIVGIVICAP